MLKEDKKSFMLLGAIIFIMVFSTAIVELIL